MNFSPFSCPIFLGHTKARGRCSQGERVLYGRDLCRSGGTGKAEAAKLPGAGIGPKQCPEKCAAEKGYLPNQTASWAKADSSQRSAKLLVTQCHYGIDTGCAAGGQVAGGEGDQ